MYVRGDPDDNSNWFLIELYTDYRLVSNQDIPIHLLLKINMKPHTGLAYWKTKATFTAQYLTRWFLFENIRFICLWQILSQNIHYTRSWNPFSQKTMTPWFFKVKNGAADDLETHGDMAQEPWYWPFLPVYSDLNTRRVNMTWSYWL